MSVKRYSVGVDGTDPNGNLVKYEDYAALEQQLAESQREFRAADATIENLQMQLNAEREAKLALAAENAGLKDINAWCKTDAFKNMYREFKTAESLGCQDVDCMHDAILTEIMHAPETPATGVFLAEVRAQGVEMFAAWNDKHIKKGVEHKESLTAVSHAARGFAAQLRKGAQS